MRCGDHVHVGVDQSRKYHPAPGIDHTCVGNLHRFAGNLFYALATDNDLLVRHQGAAFTVEHAGIANHLKLRHGVAGDRVLCVQDGTKDTATVIMDLPRQTDAICSFIVGFPIKASNETGSSSG